MTISEFTLVNGTHTLALVTLFVPLVIVSLMVSVSPADAEFLPPAYLEQMTFYDSLEEIDRVEHNEGSAGFSLPLLPSLVGENNIIFYESFQDLASIQQNGGTVTGTITFIPSIIGNGANMSSSTKVCYPLQGNFDQNNGTIAFWAKPSINNHLGFFDIGNLRDPNSWGIFKNEDFVIMEVKSKTNSFDQAWSEDPLYDDRWHHIVAPWYRDSANTTYFKVYVDGDGKEGYDGIQKDSFPNTTGNFCVGWNLWYGYSESVFDDVIIYNYTMPASDVKALYDSYPPPPLPPPKECVRNSKPESTGPVKLNCSGLYVNGEPFTVKGVGYQPIPIGKTADIPGGADVVFNSPEIYNRDFPLLRTMNATAIRTWAAVTNRSFLDAAWNNGVDPIYVVMGFWINCNENYGDPVIRQNYIDSFTDYVTEYKDHPAVLVWALGNENNLAYCSSSSYVDDFYSLANELAQTAYTIEGANHHPVGVVNGDLLNIGYSQYKSDDALMSYTDFWGSNVYPGETFGDWFDIYASLTGKPLLVTEYGIDALNNTLNSTGGRDEYQDVQAEWDLNQWYEINEASVTTIGATVMAYSDEWWKASGSLSTHDYGGYATDRHPDGFSNEEWWGVMRTVDNGANPDIMQPRQVYYAFSDAFSNRKNISLQKGWNLISLPFELENPALVTALSSISGKYSLVYSYVDGAWYIYNSTGSPAANNLTTLDHQYGYWIKMNQDAVLILYGTVPEEGVVFSLSEGWNLVGYPSLVERPVEEVFAPIMGDIERILSYDTFDTGSEWKSYDPDKPPFLNTLTTIKPGFGYWVKVKGGALTNRGGDLARESSFFVPLPSDGLSGLEPLATDSPLSVKER